MPGLRQVTEPHQVDGRSIADYAYAYTSPPLDWRLCKLRPESKAPMLTEWSDPQRTVGRDSAAFVFSGGKNGCGLVHAASGTGAFDVDSVEWAAVAFAAFGIDINEILSGYPRIKGRDGRDKIIFKRPDDLCTVKLVWPAQTPDSKPVTVFELRGAGGQDVLPPSIHPDTGQPYEWLISPFDFPEGIPEAPAVLLSLWRDWRSFQRQFMATCPWAQEEKQSIPAPVCRQVSSDHGDVIGKYNAAIDIAGLLDDYGYKQKGARWLSPTSSSGIPGVVVLKESGKCFSHHASDPLNDGHSHDAFDVFCILQHRGDFSSAIKSAAVELRIESMAPPMADISALIERIKNKPEEISDNEECSFPRHLLNVPGLVGDVQRYIHESAIQPQPVLELAASLAFCGALFGRKFRSETDLRTNLYAVGVADSGSGKEHARKAIKRLMIECNILAMLGAEKLASDQGLFGAIYNSPSCLLLLDEVGRFMKTINSPKAPTHLATIATSLMELTGSADSIYTEKRRAEHVDTKTPPKIIYHPNVCMYGTTVPGRLFESITPDEIADGFLPRILIFQSDDPDPDSRDVSTRLPSPELVDAVSWYAGLSVTPDPVGNLDTIPNPRTMKESKEAQRVFADLKAIERKHKRETRGSGIDAMWARLTEHGIRLALTRAAGCNPEDPQITADDAQWGAELAQYLLRTTIVEIGRNVQRNEQEGAVNKVARFIREKGTVSFSAIGARFKNLKSHEREDIIATLIEAGDVTAFKQATDGRTVRMIVWGGMGDKGSASN